MIVENIKFIRQALGYNQTEFAELLNSTLPKIKSYEGGRAKPNKKTLQRLLSLTVLSSVYNLFERELSEQDLADLKGWREKPIGEVKKWIDERVELYEKLLLNSKLPSRQESQHEFKAPFLRTSEHEQYLKSPEFLKLLIARREMLLPPGINPAGAIWMYFELYGDSMAPGLPAGSIVLTTQVPQIDWPKINNEICVVIAKIEGLVCKRVKYERDKFTLISDNPIYEPYSVYAQEVKEIWQYRSHISFTAPATPAELLKLLNDNKPI